MIGEPHICLHASQAAPPMVTDLKADRKEGSTRPGQVPSLKSRLQSDVPQTQAMTFSMGQANKETLPPPPDLTLSPNFLLGCASPAKGNTTAGDKETGPSAAAQAQAQAQATNLTSGKSLGDLKVP